MQNDGVVAPGDSIGVLQVSGAYTQQAGGVLEIEIGGSSASHVDLLTVGAATLDGELSLRFIGGVIPSVNVALTATSLSGQFDNVLSGQRLSTVDGGGSFLVHYGSGSPFDPTQIVLSAFLPPTGLPGDYNQNGIVDAADYTLWRDHLGAPAGTLPNDIDGGVIGPDQYATWRTNFGQSTGSGSGASANTAVPEPETLSMLLVGILTTFSRRRPAVS